MLAPGVNAKTLLFGTATPSVYEVMGYEGGVGVVFALIFTILELLAAGALFAIAFLKIKFDFDWIVAFAAAFIALLGGIFFFLTKTFVAADYSNVSLGAGAILCAIFSLLNVAAFAFYGLQIKK